MWPYVDHTAEGAALKQASTLGAVLQAPFVSMPATAVDGLPANDTGMPMHGAAGRIRWRTDAAQTASNTDHPQGRGLVARLSRLVREWARRRTLEATLLSMDDHQLDDIGLTRADIDAVVSGRLRRPRR